ncbi:hypothetical protein A7D16_16260 [Xanthomonas nasturtii]|uniref:DUF6792 domain-containing protein n=1 Tax=Xanthomonas nasturtii TaxID=1843581 RepID=UPI0007E41B2D|nr:DUF6792 domain-containing protein [Xanthomonas nasturtii]OAX87262.1 hypothetical protein A7D16_16260 [Xanthomonas nasturtii]WVL57097.1 DUF6792 domain-containing protein [Xanthomonas nasturtii]
MSLTEQQNAFLANDVYARPGETGSDSTPVKIGGVSFRRLEYMDRPSGYQGIIYEKIETGEIIVAHRGTEFDRQPKQDGAYADGGMVAARHNRQVDDAIELTQHALKYAEQKHLKTGQPAPDVTVTGHSLGGNLAQVTAHHFGLKGETFNAYGAVSLDRRIPEGGNDVINHVMAGDAVSAASKYYGQVKVYAASHEITALDRAGYANDSSLLDARNPMVATDLGDSHRIHNFLPLDANGKPDRSVLEDPQTQLLARQHAPMIDKYRGDVETLRMGVTFNARVIQGMSLADGIDHLRDPLLPGAGRAEMAATRWQEVQQRMQSEDAPAYVPPGWKMPIGESLERCVAPAPAMVSNDPLYRSIHSKLPEGTSDEVAMHATVEAKRAGILRDDQLQSVTLHQGSIFILGQTPGFRAKVDLSEAVPPLQESVRQSQALDAQRSQQDTVEQAPTRSM